MIATDEKLNMAAKLDVKRFFLHLWKLLAPIHRILPGMLFLIVSIELSRLLGPYFLKLLIDTITNFEAEEIKKVLLLISAIFFSNQLVSILAFFEDHRIFKVIALSESSLFNNAQQKMVSLGLTYHERENTGNKIIKIQRGVYKINDLLSNFFWEVAPTILQIIFTAIVLFFTDWRFGIIIIVLVPFFVILTMRANQKAYPFREKMHEKEEEASGIMTQSVININTVKSFVQEHYECTRFRKIIREVMELFLFGYGKILGYNLKRNIVIDSGRALVLFLGVYLVWKGNSIDITFQDWTKSGIISG